MTEETSYLGRRSFLAASSAAVGSTVLPTTTSARPTTAQGRIEALEFFSSSALLNAQKEPLRDEEQVVVWSKPTARETVNREFHKGEPAYGPDERVPLVAIDDVNVEGTVVGAASQLVIDGTDWAKGNEEFLLNLWDQTTGRFGGTSRTVLFHEYQRGDSGENTKYYTLDQFSSFASYAEERGYRIVTDTSETPTDQRQTERDPTGLAVAIQRENPDIVMLGTPLPLDEVELRALKRYVADGGVVFLHDQADPVTYGKDRNRANPASALNEIAATLGIGFRFPRRELQDPTHNAGPDWVPVTDEFNIDSFPDLFEDRTGLKPDDRPYGYEGEFGYVADGDTVTINVDATIGMEVRILGIDTPETRSSAAFDRPQEWEGLAERHYPWIERLQFNTARSLVTPDGGRLSDDGLVPVRSEPTAKNTKTGERDFVDYGDGPVPLVAADEHAVGFGSLLVHDTSSTATENPRFDSAGNEEFLRNVLDDHLGGGRTLLFDGSHGQTYTLDEFSRFEQNLEIEGEQKESDADPDTGLSDERPSWGETWTVESITDRSQFGDRLAEADGLVVTPPTEGFSAGEKAALSEFVAEGGTVFLHARADEPVEPLNEVAAAVDAEFRFNDDQVTDPESNYEGTASNLRTSNFTTYPDDPSYRFPFFFDRINNFESANISRSYPSLRDWAERATAFAEDKLTGKGFIRFDQNAARLDGLGRWLAHVYHDADKDGKTDTWYNREIVEEGYARVYDSGFADHDEVAAAEREAMANLDGIWSDTDPANTPVMRNRPVDQLFVPDPASVTTVDGPLPADRTPVLAEPTAQQQGSPTVAYDRPPLVGIDDRNGVAMLGGNIVEERYQIIEDRVPWIVKEAVLDVNSHAYGNYVFLAQLLRRLSRRDGDVLIDGGHGQFAADKYASSGDDAAQFQRFLEGFDIGLWGINDLDENLDRWGERALIITQPTEPFTDAEIEAVRKFSNRGGAVILLGSAKSSAAERRYLNELAAGIGTDLRLNTDAVLDPEHNLKGGLDNVPVTSAFDEGTGLFDRLPVEDPNPVPTNRPGGPKGAPASAGPSVTVEGSRSTDAPSAPVTTEISNKPQDYLEGTTYLAFSGRPVRFEITVSDVNRPVTIQDSLPGDWTVKEEGDVTNVEDIYHHPEKGTKFPRSVVELGRVTPGDVSGESTVTRSYTAIPPEYPANEEVEGASSDPEIDQYPVKESLPAGPARATAIQGQRVLESQFTGAQYFLLVQSPAMSGLGGPTSGEVPERSPTAGSTEDEESDGRSTLPDGGSLPSR